MDYDARPEIGRLRARIEQLENGGDQRVNLSEEAVIALDSMREEVKILKDRLDGPKVPAGGPGGGRTPGTIVTSDRSGLEQVMRGGQYRFSIPGGFRLDPITSDSVGGYPAAGVLRPERGGFLAPLARTSLILRDILPSRRLETGEFHYIRQISHGEASPQGGEGQLKHEANLVWEAASTRIATFASYVTISKQIVADLPELKRIIDVDLRQNVVEAEQAMMLLGVDAGPDSFDGLMTAATAFETGRLLGGDSKLDFLRHAISQLHEADEAPDFAVLNPSDYWAIRGLKDQSANVGSYVFAPAGGTRVGQFVWGLPVALSTAVPQGEFLVGSSARCQILDREEAMVLVSLEHSDYMTRNLALVLAESRVGLAIFNSAGFVTGSFDGSSPA